MPPPATTASSTTSEHPGATSPMTAKRLQTHVGGSLSGDAEVVITGVNTIDLAQAGELAFAESEKYLGQVRHSLAAAIIVPKAFPEVPDRTLLRVDNPRLAFTNAMYLLQPAAPDAHGIHRQAIVAPDAELGEGVTIRECAVVRSRAVIGSGSVIESGVHIGEGVLIGERCLIGPNVVIMRGCQIGSRVIIHSGTVIGADGFGYVWTEGRYLKIPQVGTVIIEDDVELGANVCVDRATLGATIVRRGTKVDNLVQIAHNDVIGEHVSMSGQVGLAGSVRVGNRVLFAGQAGVVDHVTIGDDARIAAQAAVIKDVPAKTTVWGTPARPIEKVKRELAALSFLPSVLKQLRCPKPARRRKAKS